MISDWMEEKIAEKKMNKHQYNSFSYCYDLTTDEERYEKIAQSLA